MRVHTVWNDKLEDRFDVEYYQPEYYHLLNQLTSKNKIIKLAELGHIYDGPFGSNLKNEEYEDNGIPLLRVQNVKNGKLYLENNSTVFISEEKHNELKRSEVLPGDVVITKTGWLGNSAVIPASVPKANIRADLAGVRLTNKQILPEFLALFIDSNIGKKLMTRLNSGSTRGRVVVSNIKKLQIPLLPIEKQKEIIAKAQDVFIENSKNKQQAHELQNSIDNYILDELGISINKTDNSTTFTVWSDEIEGRLDISYYRPPFKQNIYIKTGNKLNELADIVCGPFGSAIKVSDYKEKGIPLIRIANIKQGTITKELTFIDEALANKYPSTQVKPNDIVVGQRGTLGQFAQIPEYYKKWSISANLIAIKNIRNVLPLFLLYVLNSQFISQQIIRNISGQVQPKITTDTIKNLIIPVPQIELQKEIVEEVNKRKQKARALFDDVSASSEEAKKKIEEMILGS
jgi:restriction endonuclease S subunit